MSLARCGLRQAALSACLPNYNRGRILSTSQGCCKGNDRGPQSAQQQQQNSNIHATVPDRIRGLNCSVWSHSGYGPFTAPSTRESFSWGLNLGYSASPPTLTLCTCGSQNNPARWSRTPTQLAHSKSTASSQAGSSSHQARCFQVTVHLRALTCRCWGLKLEPLANHVPFQYGPPLDAPLTY